MSLKIVVTDEQTGETQEKRIPAGDFILITAHPCVVYSSDTDPAKKTATVKVKNYNPKTLPDVS